MLMITCSKDGALIRPASNYSVVSGWAIGGCLYLGTCTSRIFHTSTITENSGRYIWCQLRQTLPESQSPNIDKS